MLSIASELGDSLSNQDVEPIQAFGLVAVDVVVCFIEDSRSSQGRGISKHARAFSIEGLRPESRGRASQT